MNKNPGTPEELAALLEQHGWIPTHDAQYTGVTTFLKQYFPKDMRIAELEAKVGELENKLEFMGYSMQNIGDSTLSSVNSEFSKGQEVMREVVKWVWQPEWEDKLNYHGIQVTKNAKFNSPPGR